MVASTAWRELARFEDLSLARAVATSIAAMEFDVRLHGVNGAAEEEEPPRGPFRVEVTSLHWSDLVDVLDEIVDEQVEFDRRLADGGRDSDAAVVIFITLTGAVDVLVLLGLLDL